MQNNSIDATADREKHSPIDYSRKWYVMFAVGIALSLETIDTGIVNLALPTFVRTFQSDFATVQWVVLAFVLTQTALMLVMGRLGDMFGKKPIFIAGFALTGVGVLLCALAPNITWLLVFRVVQAIGVAMALALSMGVVAEAFPPNERGMALGMVSSVVSIGIILGPVLGGLILDTLSWRWIFLVSLPLCVIGLPVAIRYLPDVRPVKSEGRFDYAGGITFFILLFCFLLATTYGRSLGYGDWRILALLAVVMIFFLAFLFIELRTGQPVIDLRLFQHRLFSINLALRFTSFIVYVGILFLLPFYNENVLGLSPRISGLLLTVPSIAFGIVGILAGILSDRFGSRFVAMAGIVLLLFGAWLLSTLSATTSILGYALRLIPLGAGLGMFQSPNNSVIFSVAPRERLGMVSSLNSVIRTLARSASIALIGTVWASRVLVHSGGLNGDSTTDAPPAAQLLAMQETFLLTVVLVFVMLLLSLWDWRQAK